ncbi:3-hydroxyacyl-CoA dehydrogenase family protein [Micromonospora sp. NPDC050397]|uniref:3-hydroxyacyl-CoA dehydrogenase family protein n=1 Tax=Micromonospora sp. NPDC050397 TaxID=3364279 RepID=UPI003850E3DD
MAGEITSVGVIGLGTMGAGIVEVFARNGVEVLAVEISEEALERGRATLAGSTDRAVARGRLTAEQRDALLGRVRFVVGLAALSDVDLVVEAVPERLDLKRRVFGELDRICRPDTILATNTSSLSVTEISVATSRPRQVVGLHFFNPAPVMKLVEVVRTVVTAAEVVDAVEALCARLGKVAVTIADRAGFIANALLFGYLNQAVELFESRYATREDLDAAMRLGAGLPMGPLALLDLIGLDTAYEILDTMYRRGGRNRRHAPVPLIRQMVTAGLLGRKSGRGFYTYQRPGSGVVVPDETTPPVVEPAVPVPVGETPTASGGGAARGPVGLVGAGPLADALAEIFAAAGHRVVTLTGEESELTPLAEVDLVVEAVADDPQVKRALFARLDQVCRPGTVFATTTSVLPVIDLAMASGRPADVVGLHFPRPVGERQLVEVARTVRSSVEAVAAARTFGVGLGRTVVVCADRPGYVVDALLFPYLNDAIRMLEASYATVEDIDHAMRLGCAYPVGPFELLDEVGLDVALEVQRSVYRATREPGLAPAPLLEQLVTVGHLGRGTGRGFREWTVSS